MDDEQRAHSHHADDAKSRVHSESGCTAEQLTEALGGISVSSVLSHLSDRNYFFSILISTPDGMILYTNQVGANGFAGFSQETIPGKNLAELAPKEWADERIRLMQRVHENQRAVTLIETLAGTRLQTTIRPFEIECAGKKCGLLFLVVEPISAKQLAWLREQVPAEDLVMAEFIDLGPLNVLTPREIEVLALMGQGLRQKQIAEKLHRSLSTIERHRERIGEKLGITDRAELIAMARNAVLEPEDAHRNHTALKPPLE